MHIKHTLCWKYILPRLQSYTKAQRFREKKLGDVASSRLVWVRPNQRVGTWFFPDYFDTHCKRDSDSFLWGFTVYRGSNQLSYTMQFVGARPPESPECILTWRKNHLLRDTTQHRVHAKQLGGWCVPSKRGIPLPFNPLLISGCRWITIYSVELDLMHLVALQAKQDWRLGAEKKRNTNFR